MRLLNTSSLAIEYFIGDSVPPYAILSHTWGADEVSLQNLESGDFKQDGIGFMKIKMCCKLALEDGFEYAWVDTCCIDKKDGAELSEAINSMYRWYHEADVCYAYLDDVSVDDDLYEAESSFRNSRWFTRGWTLQELIAPSSVILYDREWMEIGTKQSLKVLISEVSGIHLQLFFGLDLESFSIAQKMSWASKRRTTRKEDTAYCLMGIFDIHMPMLYGEGDKAFIRLQEELLRKYNDHSIFAWHRPISSQINGATRGLLALRPALFSESANIVQIHGNNVPRQITLTSNGIRMQLPMKRLLVRRELREMLDSETPDAGRIIRATSDLLAREQRNKNIIVLVVLECLHEQNDGRVCLLLRNKMPENSKLPPNTDNRHLSNVPYTRIDTRMLFIPRQSIHLASLSENTFFGVNSYAREERFIWHVLALETRVAPQLDNFGIFVRSSVGRATFEAIPNTGRVVMNAVPQLNEPVFFVLISSSGNAFAICLDQRLSVSSLYMIGLTVLKSIQFPQQASHGTFQIHFRGRSFYFFTPSEGVLQYGRKECSDRICWDWVEGKATVRASLKNRAVSGMRKLVLSVTCEPTESSEGQA